MGGFFIAKTLDKPLKLMLSYSDTNYRGIRMVIFICGAVVIVGVCGFMIWSAGRGWSRDVDRITKEICGEVDSRFPGQRTVGQKELAEAVKKDLGV